MFRKISINKPIKQGKRKIINIVDSQKVNYSIGRPEWQQEIKSTSRIFHDVKKLTDNRYILNKNYLKHNYSQIDLHNYPQENPFLTSNRRDFKTLNLKDISKLKSESEEAKARIKFIRSSHIKFGESDLMEEKESMNSFNYNAPIHQKLRFDYNKINFRYDPYNVHPITNKLIWKDHTKMYPFDYFNKDKDKHYVIPRSNSFINTDYTKVYDPITNRFFIGSLQGLPTIKS